MKILSIVLLLVAAFLSIKHGWDAFQPAGVEQEEMMTILSITKSIMPYFGVFSILIGLMLFFPQTFFIGEAVLPVDFRQTDHKANRETLLELLKRNDIFDCEINSMKKIYYILPFYFKEMTPLLITVSST